MAIIEAIKDADATKELLSCTDNIIIYHTKNDNIHLTIRKRRGISKL